MRVLVTGAGGLLGLPLCAALREEGADVVALGRPDSAARRENLHFEFLSPAPEAADFAAVLSRHKPDLVYHLAGVGGSAPSAEIEIVNVRFGAALMAAADRLARPPRLILAGSAAEYGPPLSPGRLMREDDPARPSTAYGRSKLAQTEFALAHPALSPMIARIFNIIGPGMPRSSAPGRFVAELAALAPEGGTIATGPLGAIRDFVPLSGAVTALLAMGRKGLPSGVYNLCTGSGRPILDIANGLARLAPFPVRFVPEAAIPGGVDWAVGSPEKLAACGIVVPPTPLEPLLAEMLHDVGIGARR